MVGVKGKFKGCNTCRKRRVACDNTRPFCKKCTGHGRQCEGYQTETVFIVGTLKDKGRCASHPPRNLQAAGSSSGLKKKATDTTASSSSPEPAKSRRRAASEGEQKDAQLDFTEINPIKSSWADTVNVASVAGLHQLRFAAIHTKLNHVRRRHERLGDWEVKLSLPTSARADVVPPFTEDDFQLEAECFVFLPRGGLRAVDQSPDWVEPEPQAMGLCLFLYEQTASASHSNKPPWKNPAILNSPIHRLGPEAFKVFPAHHFFTRVYRPNAIFAALLNHNPTPMADPEWRTVPWERSPKTSLDTLLDVISQLPAVLSRTDRVFSLHPGLFRSLRAKDILSVCTNIENQFAAWYADTEAAALKSICPLLYWPSAFKGVNPETGQWEQGQSPFEITYEFSSSEGGLAHIYYWTGMIVLYGMMTRLVDLSRAENANVGSASNSGSNNMMFDNTREPMTQTPVTPTTNFIQTQGPGHAYVSNSTSAHSYGSIPPEDMNSPQTSAYLPYYSPQPSSPYPASMSSQNSPSVRIGDDVVPLLDPNKYGQRAIRILAANVCRSLDWAIGHPDLGIGPLGQPDLIAAPLYIVERFYDGIGASGDGALERLWCAGFRERWEHTGREIEARILGGPAVEGGVSAGAGVSGPDSQGRAWIELCKFGA